MFCVGCEASCEGEVVSWLDGRGVVLAAVVAIPAVVASVDVPAAAAAGEVPAVVEAGE